jgi:hypothetical protein
MREDANSSSEKIVGQTPHRKAEYLRRNQKPGRNFFLMILNYEWNGMNLSSAFRQEPRLS